MEKWFKNQIIIGIIIVLAAAFIIFSANVLRKWFIRIIQTCRIIHYMKEAYKTKFRSKYFDTEGISANVNLSKSEVEKLCTKSNKILKIISGYSESWVLRKYFKDGEEIPHDHRLV